MTKTPFYETFVVSSGMWFIFIMSYGIYSVDVILSLYINTRQVFDYYTVRLFGSLYFEYVRMHVCFLSQE